MICFSTVRNLAKSNYGTLLSEKNTRLNTDLCAWIFNKHVMEMWDVC